MSPKASDVHPPRWPDKLLERFCAPHLLEEVMGDLHERYYLRVQRVGEAKARKQYWREILAYMRPYIFKREKSYYSNTFDMDMLKNYFKIALRNLTRYKAFSVINIGGLAIGLTVAMLIGLWIYDELTFNQYHENYDRIARVMQHRTIGDQKVTWSSTQVTLGEALRNTYGSDFERVVTSSFSQEQIFTYHHEKFSGEGFFMEKEGPDVFSLHMLQGRRELLNDPTSIFISASFAKTLFGDQDPIGKILEITEETQATIKGVYEDIPANSDFAEADFFGSWGLFLSLNDWVKKLNNPWGFSGFQTFVQLAPHAKLEQVSTKMKDIILNNVAHDQAALSSKPETFLHPMRKWHLYWRFENGVNTGGSIETVWLFGIIGVFVLLLACINFMNLSTARSEKRAKEVGVRKVIGSARTQLISQFYSESMVVALIAFVVSLGLVWLLLPWFNEIADKKISLLWDNPWFWGGGLAFTVITGLLAGSYPALYLSAFNPLKVLKGTFRAGRSATIPRKVLVITQFTVSTVLIIGTLTVYQQIQYGQNRPLGYNQDNLVTIYTRTGDIIKPFELIRRALLQRGMVEEMAKSSSPITSVWGTSGDLDWPGKDPDLGADFPNTAVTHEYGKTVGWQFVAGRDFSRDFVTDTAAFVINEAAAEFMGLENPVGETIKWDDRPYQIIGVIKNMVVESPYAPIRPYFYHIDYSYGDVLTLKLNPNISANQALSTIETVIKKYEPEAIIEQEFVNDEYGKKFNAERKVGNLSSIFAILAIFISCLGLFGLTAYMAEQRAKEIGIRKVLGASVIQLWRMLSKDFMVLVVISCFIAIPVAYYFLQNWLQNFDYRTGISWWIFVAVGAVAMVITLLTVSFQTIKAALANPVDSLRNE